jgi:hypothetical protein
MLYGLLHWQLVKCRSILISQISVNKIIEALKPI